MQNNFMLPTPKEIKQQAILKKKTTQNLTLTQIQHKLVQEYGFKNYQSFLASYTSSYLKSDSPFEINIKHNMLNNNKTINKLLNDLKDVSQKYMHHADLWQNTEKDTDELAFLAQEELLYTLINEIGSLIIPSHYFYKFTDHEGLENGSLDLVFALFNDGYKMGNDYEGQSALYHLVINYDDKYIETSEKTDEDANEWGWQFPQI